ncbi:PNPOx family protein [Streptomyces albus]|uniref:pyridoxamine 5'-phosphate oxidase family protein n=1 Tax=Streptomyces sp. NRRL F-5917 TaxID=1463873 RepID=UPI00068C3B62|nr:pyridoxamine 5'-phosphate oxidase family protein [Streptomyces sp. NRRL F-5917]
MSDNGGATVHTPVTHHGEQAVQRRVGEGGPRHGSPMFGPRIPPGHGEFLAGCRMVVLGSVDGTGAVWATLLTGERGFARPLDETFLAVAALPAQGDPLRQALEETRPGGLLVLDPERARRVRFNGPVRREGEGLLMRTEQVLRNCAKYIQQREPLPDGPARVPARSGSGTGLTAEQRRWIARCDTFFVASHSPAHGADASHRGGRPGFVTVDGERHLSWPDYRGNSFYMTFGNLELDARCGLLFVDWESGHTLQVTGECHVDWQDRSAPGARRTVHFTVHRVTETQHATRLRWRLAAYSSSNP